MLERMMTLHINQADSHVQTPTTMLWWLVTFFSSIYPHENIDLKRFFHCNISQVHSFIIVNLSENLLPYSRRKNELIELYSPDV